MFAIPVAIVAGFFFQSIYWYYYFRRVNWSIHICIVCTPYRSLVSWQILIFSLLLLLLVFFVFRSFYSIRGKSVCKEFSLLFIGMYFYVCIFTPYLTEPNKCIFPVVVFVRSNHKNNIEKRRNTTRARCPLSEQFILNNCWYLFSELQMKCIKLYGQLFVFARERKKNETKEQKEKWREKTEMSNIIAEKQVLY